MLSALRHVVKSIFFKIFMLLLVLSFAVWGIGDIFTGGAPNRVAEVGDLDVTATELDEDFRQSLRQLQQQSQQPLTRADAIRFGLLEQSLQRLIARRVLDAEAATLGVTTSDATVARLITDEPAFQIDGRFDRNRFEALLRQNGINESAFAESLRAERTRDAIAGAVRPVSSPPEALAAPLADRLSETRSGELLVVPVARFADAVPTDDAELESYLTDNAARFQAPERRDVTAVLLDAQVLIDELAVDDAVLRERYAAQADAYRTPERRSVRQLRGDDEALLRAAYDELLAGADPVDVADANDGIGLSALGDVEEGNLPDAFSGPIFTAGGVGAVTPPTESAFGWHVFIVDAITPSTVQPFEEVRDELRLAVVREQAAAQLPDLAVALDDALGAGGSLEQAAADLALPVVQAEGIDQGGLTPDGEPFAAFVDWGTVLFEAFAAFEGETSLLEETPDGRYFVLRVDAIEEPRPLTLAEARDDVLAAWRAEHALTLAQETAQAALDELEGGAAMDTVVATYDLERRAVEARARSDAPRDPSVQVALFTTTPGEIGDEVVTVSDGAAIVIVAAETGFDAAVAEATRAEIGAGLAEDLLIQYEVALRRDHPVRIDRSAIDRLFPLEIDG